MEAIVSKTEPVYQLYRRFNIELDDNGLYRNGPMYKATHSSNSEKVFTGNLNDLYLAIDDYVIEDLLRQKEELRKALDKIGNGNDQYTYVEFMAIAREALENTDD